MVTANLTDKRAKKQFEPSALEGADSSLVDRRDESPNGADDVAFWFVAV